MAKYIAQVIILGSQVIGRALARALREEYAATQQAARRGQGDPKVQAESNIKHGITLEEAKQILNVESPLNLDDVLKSYEHLFSANDKTKGGSLYLQSKAALSCLLSEPWTHEFCQVRYFSVVTFNEVFSNFSKERFIERAKSMKPLFPVRGKNEAAVMVPLCKVKGEPSVLFTMRSATVGTNKGDASFPGGMKEVSDKTVIDIALRETQEEIGVLLNVDVWTTLPPFPSRIGGVKVTPVVAYLGDICLEKCSVNKDEVEYVFTLTLESLCNPQNFYYTQYKSGYKIPIYKIGEHHIWGLTAVILHCFLKVFLPDSYKNEIDTKTDRLNIVHR